jgi:hypothetical protein
MPLAHAPCSLVRRLHESLFLYELPPPTLPSPFECHVHAVLTGFHRTGGQPQPQPQPAPHGEALTLLGAALKYNGLSFRHREYVTI